MKELVWGSNFEIGIEEIDRQHMEFVKLLRRFNIGLQKALPLTIQLQILKELMKFADYHFCSEQNIMILTNYPHLVHQQSEHARFLISLDHRVGDYRRARQGGQELTDFLYNWFVNHTQTEDRKIAAHIANEQKANPAIQVRFETPE
jgi:hemerythrin